MKPAAELTPQQLETLIFIGDGKNSDRMGGRGGTIYELLEAGLLELRQFSDFCCYVPTAAGTDRKPIHRREQS